MNFFQAIAWILFRINWRARIFSLRENFFGYLARPPISFLMVRPLVLRKSRTRSRQHLCQLKRSLYLCEDTVGVLFIHFSMNLSTLSLAAWISLVRWLWHLSLWTIDNSRSYGVTLQMKATEQYFHNTVLIVFFCILQNEILNSFRILTWPFLGVNGEWVNGGNRIWNSANLFFWLTRFCCRHRRNKLPY